MIADQHTITHFITNDNMSPCEIAIPVSVHVAPKNGWQRTNSLSQTRHVTMYPERMDFEMSDNMATKTTKSGKVIELAKEDFGLYCPVTWTTTEGNRRMDAVDKVHAIILDMDGLDDKTTQDVFKRLDGVCYVAFTSYSHGVKGNAFRVILPINRPIDKDDYLHVWKHVYGIFPENDVQTKDASRLWFVPSCRSDRETLTWKRWGEGGMIDIDRILATALVTIPTKPKRTTNVSTHTHTDVRGSSHNEERYKIITVPAHYPITGHDGQQRPFDWYIEQWDNLPKRQSKYQCYATGSDSMGSAFISKATDVWGVSRFRCSMVNKRKMHMDCVTTYNGLELQYSAKNSAWHYLKSVDNLMTMMDSLSLDIWMCEIRQSIFSKDKPMTDALELKIMNELRQRFFVGRTLDLKSVQQAITLHATDHTKNTLVEYLESVADKWDGKNRLDTLLIDYMKADDTKLNRAYGRYWAISAVARAMSPGCQVESMLVLKAGQGHGKGTFFRILAGHCPITNYPWYNSSKINIGEKDGQSILRTAWIHEMAELAVMAKKDANTIKNFISDLYDTFRRAYTKYEVKVPRTSIFTGSTNDDDVGIFKDKTGSRRYWYVVCKSIEHHMGYDPAILKENRDQIWAEAVARFKLGEKWYLSPEEEKWREEENESHSVVGIHESLVEQYLSENPDSYFTVADMIDTVYNTRTTKPANYENYYPSLLIRLGAELQNNGRRCRRGGLNKTGIYRSPSAK